MKPAGVVHDELHSALAPISTDVTDPSLLTSGKKMIPDARHLSRASYAPYALGKAADETAPVMPSPSKSPAATPAAGEKEASFAKISDGSAARLARAFAKRDTQRQGKLAPADFAAAVRELGVPLSEGSVRKSGVGGHACSNLSNDTIDYLKFIESLSPNVGGIAKASVQATWNGGDGGGGHDAGGHGGGATAGAAAAAAAKGGVGAGAVVHGLRAPTSVSQEIVAAADAARSATASAAAAERASEDRARSEKKRLFGQHAHVARSQVALAPPAAATAAQGAPAALHQHAAFRGGAGLEMERAGVDRRAYLPDTSQTSVLGDLLSHAAAGDGGSDGPGAGGGRVPPPPHPAGCCSTPHSEAWPTVGGKAQAPRPDQRVNADRIIRGDMDDGVGGGEGEGGGAQSAAPAVDIADSSGVGRGEANWHYNRHLPNHSAVADEIIYGRDMDMSTSKKPLQSSLAAAFEGAAGLDSSGVERTKTPYPPSMYHADFSDSSEVMATPRSPPRPLLHNRSTADSLILGRDLDGSAALNGGRPELDELKAAGAAGDGFGGDLGWTPRAAYLDDEVYSGRSQRRHLDGSASQRTGAVAASLRGWGAGETPSQPDAAATPPVTPRGSAAGAPTSARGTARGSAAVDVPLEGAPFASAAASGGRPSRRAYVAPPPSRFSTQSTRAHVGPPPKPNPIRTDRHGVSGAAPATARVWNADAATRADLAVTAATTSQKEAAGGAAGGGAGGGAAGVPPGTKVLRLSMSPPVPSRTGGKAMAPASIGSAQRAGSGAAAALGMSSGGAPAAPATPRAAWEAHSSAGLESHRSVPANRSVSAVATPWGGETAAGRRSCDFSSHQRRFGGQLEVTGGLG